MIQLVNDFANQAQLGYKLVFFVPNSTGLDLLRLVWVDS